MADEGDMRERLAALVDTQGFGVLCTSAGGEPHASLVAVARAEGLRRLLFATARDTRKFAQMTANPRAALLLDDRGEAADVSGTTAVTARGLVEEVPIAQRAGALEAYLGRHPQMEPFVRERTSALMRLSVQAYRCVLGLDDVRELAIAENTP
jgi:nitroimidazol reductase NimA-like FMN-containing flavoprotein (pyridoxamine 5'-phosphate oxidase superfamily)